MRSGSTVLLTAISVIESALRRTRAAARAMRSRISATLSAIAIGRIIGGKRAFTTEQRRHREKQRNFTAEARSRGERRDCRLFFVECQYGLQQDVGAVFHVLRTRELFGRMAYSADAGNKDHSHRPKARDLLRVMPGSAGHQFCCEPERPGRLVDELLKTFIG